MHKFIRNYIVVPLITVIIIITASRGVVAYPLNEDFPLGVNGFVMAGYDTIPLNKTDTISSADSLPIINDSTKIGDTTLLPVVDSFALKLSKDTLSAPIEYQAEDSIVGFVNEKIIVLHGKAVTTYDDMELNAPTIELDQTKSLIRAKAGTDSTGALSDYAQMKQGDQEFKSDSMEYNFKTQKGLTKGTITQQGEMFVHSQIVKKVDERTMYGLGTFLTTCNLDHPHFGFRAKRAKIINKKLAVTGAVRPEFDSVPVPIYLPFGFYPLYQGRHSGVLSPSFETNDQMGLGLSGLGYYYVINDYWDVQVTGNVYSYGSWAVNVRPTYRKIYKYQGSASFGFQQTRRNFKGDPDFFKLNTYQLNWSHSSDQRSRPGTSFSASVNASSTKYNENIPNSNYLNFQNSLGSSITYSKTWQDRPFNLSISANHNQVNVSRVTTISFPNIAFNMNTLYPFERKEAVGSKKWYEQLGVGYQFSFRNTLSFYDTLKVRQERGVSLGQYLLDTTRWGASNSIPITLSLPPILGGAVNVSPSVSYSFDILDRVTEFSYGQIEGRDTNYAHFIKVPALRHRASFGLGFNTAAFGKFRLKNGSQIRHTIRPTLGFSYSPDLSQNEWRTVKVDSSGTTVLYNRLSESPYLNRTMSQFVSKKFGGLNFSFDNNLEMKKRVKKKKSEPDPVDSTLTTNLLTDSTNVSEALAKTKEDESEYKKIRLIEGFGFNTSYNLFADSMKLAPFSMYFRTNLFEKININAAATLVPYVLSQSGMATSKYAWQGDKFGIGKITNANISMSTSFQSKPKDPEKEKKKQDAINEALNDPMLQGDQQRLLEYMRTNPAEFVDFNTQWSSNVSFQLSYSRGAFDSTKAKWQNRITSSTMISGSFNLTPKWNISLNGGYDFTTSKIQTVSMSISRDLHCWQMSINVSPIGVYRFFSFTISPKASILQDLKINRNRSFYSGSNY
ncbi:MAG: putative LPS assembly protein LptD [Niabella sp.]